MPIKQDGTDLMAQSENEQWSSKRFLDDSLWYELESGGHTVVLKQNIHIYLT
jgi:hypothetical protein